jgi:hypothetical protein
MKSRDVSPNLNTPAGSQRGRDGLEHFLDHVHVVHVVEVGRVALHHGELGIVRAIDALVAEILRELEHALETSHEETLQVELVGDAQIQRHVERVVVRR